jgi:5'-nucleotidase / UDP-sugar diphosphatase
MMPRLPARQARSWLLTLLLCPVLANATCTPGQGLRLLHFNDFHGQLEPYTDPIDQVERGGIARLAALVAEHRTADPGHPTLLLFAGDLLQGTLTSSLFKGGPDIEIFGRMGLDAAALGNHELDYGQDNFRDLAGRARFPFLTANVESYPQALPVQATVVLGTPDAPRVAVLGLTTPELTTATHPRNIYGIAVEDPLTVARRLVPGLRAEADLVVVLSHLGIGDDRRLARAVPGIDLIVGGHNHNRYAEPIMEGEVAIVQAGERGGWLGRMEFECRDGHLVRTGYALLPIDSTSPADPELAAEVARIAAATDGELGRVAGTSAQPLSARRELIRREEAPFGDFLADEARRITMADVALFNGGGFRADLPAGPVTLKLIQQTFPFRNELVVGDLTGAELIAALARSAALDPQDSPGGFLQVSGLRYAITGGRLASVTLGGAPIDPEHRYRVVTSDFLAAGGDGYTMLTTMTDQVMTGRLISDMVIEAFRGGEPVVAHTDGRIRRLPAPGSVTPDQ